MILKIRKGRKIFEVILAGLIIILVDYVLLTWLQLNHFTNYIIGLSLIIYLSWSYFGTTYKFLYIIGDGNVKIYKGKRYKELTISSILGLERTTSIGSRNQTVVRGISEKIHIVTKDEKIEIDSRLKNTNGKGLADILINRYNKKIKDITKFFE